MSVFSFIQGGRHIRSLFISLLPSLVPFSICVAHTAQREIYRHGEKKKAPLIGSTIFSLGRQLNSPPRRKTFFFFMEDFLRINTLNHHYTDSSCHPTLSLTSSHKELEQRKKDAMWQGYNERGLRRDGRHYKKKKIRGWDIAFILNRLCLKLI